MWNNYDCYEEHCHQFNLPVINKLVGDRQGCELLQGYSGALKPRSQRMMGGVGQQWQNLREAVLCY